MSFHSPHSGTVVVVTGGASGIGRALCQLLAEQGANVVVSDVNQREGESFVAELKARGFEATFFRC